MKRKPNTTVRTSVDVSQPPEDLMDWEAFDALTNDQVRASAENDPDNPPLTKEFLSRMRRVPNARVVREGTGLSQSQFAAKYGLPLASLKDWEQGRRQPTSGVQTLMCVIQHEPDAVDRAMKKSGRTRERAETSPAPITS